MAVQDYFTAEERERQDALNRSWEAARVHLADPAARRRIDAALRELDAREPAPPITPSEFLASVGLSDQLDHDAP